MKINIKSLAGMALIVGSLFVASCSNTPKGDEAKITDEQVVDSTLGNEVLINIETSKVGFVGNGVGKNHPGFFKVSSIYCLSIPYS